MVFQDYRSMYGVTSSEIRQSADAPRAGAKTLESVAEEMVNDHRAVSVDASGSIVAPLTSRVEMARRAVVALSGKGEFVGAILEYFADRVDRFDRTVAQINADWTNRVQALRRTPSGPGVNVEPLSYSEASGAATREFVAAYNRAVQRLDDDAGEVEVMLRQGPTKKNVRTLVRAGLLGLEAAAGLGVTLTNDDRFQFYRASFRRAGVPEFSQMTEAQRKDFNREHPEYLKFLMGLDKPTEAMKADVLALAVPHLSGRDGEAAVTTVDKVLKGHGGPQELAGVLSDVAAFGFYAKWAQEHGGSPISAAQTSFLKTFYAGTWDRAEDIQKYLAKPEHAWMTVTKSESVPITFTRTDHHAHGFDKGERENLLKGFSNGLLLLSNGHFTTGGGWSSLPEGVRETITHPTHLSTTTEDAKVSGRDEFEDLVTLLRKSDIAGGDDFSRTLGAAAYLHMGATTDGGIYDVRNSFQSDTTVDQYALELAGRNRQASHDLLTGQNMDRIDVHGALGTELKYSATDFVQQVYSMSWDDDGAAAATLSNWTAFEQPDKASQKLADETYAALYKTLAGNQDVYDTLISFDTGPDQGDSLGEVNPQLARGLALQTGARLDQFDTPWGDDDTGEQRVKMMMLINSDHAVVDGKPDAHSAAVMLNASVADYSQQRIRDSLSANPTMVDDMHSVKTLGGGTGQAARAGLNSAAQRLLLRLPRGRQSRGCAGRHSQTCARCLQRSGADRVWGGWAHRRGCGRRSGSGHRGGERDIVRTQAGGDQGHPRLQRRSR